MTPHRLDITDRLRRRLIDIIDTALPLMAGSMKDADFVGLAHLREEMIEAIASYQRHAQRLLDRARETGEAAAIREAEALCDFCAWMKTAYEDFRARWVERHAAQHWPEYRLSANSMMKKVRAHVVGAGGGGM